MMTSHRIITDPMYIIGIETRTSNQEVLITLPRMWQRLFQENLIAQVPNKISSDIYAIYTTYEGDHTKPYTYILGYQVRDLTEIPPGLTGITIAPASYEVFTARGRLPDAVAQTWEEIWTPEVDARRAYHTDFEIYGEKAANQEDGEVEICIGIA
ncbi:GyrI-like domain-containing protein [Methanospirillum lacunae]|uniref:AraC family transcriptional regulator n=1 Tax=Methanospirillum lacunae TaxID=668570 RepID=A0A2V2NDL5_9EURY|nr:GyrI-like domain-containing protein [Methanospirillum lacunae]PWR73691.1 AraC family transcriptional regulator [Methanospirillum lacunae]